MKQFEIEICNALFKLYRLKFEEANFAKGFIPPKILLDGTRNIHSYYVICNHEEGKLKSRFWNDDNFEQNIKSILAVQYSDLDRPLFFIYYNNKNLMVIEGNQLREMLIENPHADIYNYIINNSDKLNDVITKIYKEL